MRTTLKAYFDGLLNFRDNREAEMSYLKRVGVLSESRTELDIISENEVVSSLKRRRSGRSIGFDGITVEFL